MDIQERNFNKAFLQFNALLPAELELSPERIPIGWKGLATILEQIKGPLLQSGLHIYWSGWDVNQAPDIDETTVAGSCNLVHEDGGFRNARFAVALSAFDGDNMALAQRQSDIFDWTVFLS